MNLLLARDQVIHLIIFQAVILIIILSNLVLIHRPRRSKLPASFDFPLVSILVPARNEQHNIARCIQSLLAQDYPSFEVLALDDQSTDDTHAILRQLAVSQPRLKVLTGSQPPVGYSGKNWACSQLANQAQGAFLFFTDADTFHHPQALRALVAAMHAENADLITGFPHQELRTWSERLLVPFFLWAMFSFMPLWLAYRLPWPAFSTALGQVMLFRRDAYRKIGGHAAVGGLVVEDVGLARKIKAAGLRWRVLHVSDLISCRMYQSRRQTVNGFSKNVFAAFDSRLLVFLFAFLWMAYLFWLPLVNLAAVAFQKAPGAGFVELLICTGLSLLLWMFPYREMHIPVSLALLYPLTILAVEVVAFRSLWQSISGRISWKDRPLAKQKWKWL